MCIRDRSCQCQCIKDSFPCALTQSLLLKSMNDSITPYLSPSRRNTYNKERKRSAAGPFPFFSFLLFSEQIIWSSYIMPLTSYGQKLLFLVCYNAFLQHDICVNCRLSGRDDRIGGFCLIIKCEPLDVSDRIRSTFVMGISLMNRG